MFSYLEYSKKTAYFFQYLIILVRECALFLPLWDLWTFVFRMWHNQCKEQLPVFTLNYLSGACHVVTQVFYFGRLSPVLLQNKVQLSLPLDKGYHPKYKERICEHIWRFRKEVTEIKGAEVASSHVGLVPVRTLPDNYCGDYITWSKHYALSDWSNCTCQTNALSNNCYDWTILIVPAGTKSDAHRNKDCVLIESTSLVIYCIKR